MVTPVECLRREEFADSTNIYAEMNGFHYMFWKFSCNFFNFKHTVHML